jgi:hypothetical protein
MLRKTLGAILGYQNVVTHQDVKQLSDDLLDPERKTPWLVVAHTAEAPNSYLNLPVLARDVADIAEVYLVETGSLTYQLAKNLPEGVSVFGDAARIYPVGFGPDSQGSDSPKFRLDAKNAKYSQKQIIDELWRRADLGDFVKQRTKRQVAETVTVSAIYPPSVAMVRRTNGDLATIRQEVCFPGVPIQWVMEKGQQLAGTFDEVNNDFVPTGSKLTMKQVVDHYGYNNLVLGLVKSADRQTGEVTVFPGLDITIKRAEITGNPRDLVMDFLVPGEVIAVRLYRDPQGNTALRMDDIEDYEDPVPALPVIEGGQPWLQEGRNFAADVIEVQEPNDAADVVGGVAPELEADQQVVTAVTTDSGSIPLPGPGLTAGLGTVETPLTGRERSNYELAVSTLTQRLRAAEALEKQHLREIQDVAAELTISEDKVAALTAELSEMRQRSAAAKRAENRVDSGKSTTRSRRSRWSTDVEWFNEELRRAWIGRYKPADRNKYPLDLTKLSYGPAFFESLMERHVTEDELRKAVRVALDIATGFANSHGLHSIHPLREDSGAASKGLTRDDGSECMRAYLEQNKPQAKRLHFWKLQTGIEFSRIGLHDDMRP